MIVIVLLTDVAVAVLCLRRGNLRSPCRAVRLKVKGGQPQVAPTRAHGLAEHRHLDKDLEVYRNLLEEPKEFRDGFGWSTVAGIFFCGLVMLPGSIYLGLMTGGSMGAASTWVTLILFNEVARRALKPLSKQHLVVLLHAAGIMLAASVLFPGGPLGPLVYRAYLVTGEMVRDAGMRESFPTWWVPSPDSPAVQTRNLLHADWAVPIALVFVLMVLGTVRRYTLGYFFFRLTSDIERLPFPLAPITAQGAMALAETDHARRANRPPKARQVRAATASPR